MSLWVERAPRRGRCWICGEPCVAAELRVVNETEYQVREEQETRYKRSYGHLACYVEVHREDARAALQARETEPEVLEAALAWVVEKDAKLAGEVSAFREAAYPKIEKRAAPLDDPRTEELLAALEAAPEDCALYAVLADHLQLCGDERGELIALDLAGEVDLERAARRRVLVAALKPDAEISARLTWGIGFLRSLDGFVSVAHRDLDRLLRHPSCRLLQVLALSFPEPATFDVGLLPASLRELSLYGRYTPLDLTRLRWLERLSIQGHVDEGPPAPVRHPTLPQAKLQNVPSEALGAWAEALPSVRTLAIEGDVGSFDALADSGWLARLDELKLSSMDLEDAHVAALERGLAGRKLALLKLSYLHLAAGCDARLRALAVTVESRHVRQDETIVSAPATEYVEHVKKPEWGRGKVLRREGDKIEIEFASGTRVFPANSPMLKPC